MARNTMNALTRQKDCFILFQQPNMKYKFDEIGDDSFVPGWMKLHGGLKTVDKELIVERPDFMVKNQRKECEKAWLHLIISEIKCEKKLFQR